MNSSTDKNIIAGLDVGTSKIAIFIGEKKPTGEIDIIAHNESPSHGLERGDVIDIAETTKTISEVLKNVQLMAGVDISSVYVSIVGTSVTSCDTQGMAPVTGEEVTPEDVERVLDLAQRGKVQDHLYLLHNIPQEYIVDGQKGISRPVGMLGSRLDVKVHLVTCDKNRVMNLLRCVERCGVKVESFILQPLASSYAVLESEEDDLGIAVVDIGAGTTDIAIFTRGALRYTHIIPIAGEQVTRDLTQHLRTPRTHAEQLKLKHGYASLDLIDENYMLEVTPVGGGEPKEVSMENFIGPIEWRYTQIFEEVKQQIEYSGHADDLKAGIVLTGGGSSIYGAKELAESIFDKPVRLGLPSGCQMVVSDLDNSKNSTGIGLIKHGFEDKNATNPVSEPEEGVTRLRKSEKSLFRKLKSFMSDSF